MDDKSTGSRVIRVCVAFVQVPADSKSREAKSAPLPTLAPSLQHKVHANHTPEGTQPWIGRTDEQCCSGNHCNEACECKFMLLETEQGTMESVCTQSTMLNPMAADFVQNSMCPCGLYIKYCCGFRPGLLGCAAFHVWDTGSCAQVSSASFGIPCCNNEWLYNESTS